jgi:hypothetical protein
MQSAGRIVNGVLLIQPIPWYVEDATFNSDGVATCATGAYMLLTPTEYNSISGKNPLSATPEQYAAVSVLFGAFLLSSSLITGARKLLKLFSSAPDS